MTVCMSCGRRHPRAPGVTCLDYGLEELLEAEGRDVPSRIDFDQAHCVITGLKIAVHNAKIAQDKAEKELVQLRAKTSTYKELLARARYVMPESAHDGSQYGQLLRDLDEAMDVKP